MTKKLLALIGLLAMLTPTVVGAEVYTIQPGDTLSRIAAAYGTTVDELAVKNGIEDPNLIYSGDTLIVGDEQLHGRNGRCIAHQFPVLMGVEGIFHVFIGDLFR